MNENRLEDYLEHIVEAAENACKFVEGLDEKSFLEDFRTQQAVNMCIVVVGEATAKVMNKYKDFVAANPQVFWHNARGMRNRLTHAYFDIDYDTVWKATQIDIPQLIAQIKQILSKLK